MSSDDTRDVVPQAAERARLRTFGFVLCESLRSALYFISFLPTILMGAYLGPAHPVTLLLILIAGFYVAGIVFMTLLILAKRAIIGNLETNQVVTVETSLGKRFIFASMLNGLMLKSPFKLLVSTLSPLTSYYYRGMGAKIASSVFISSGARISDPWFVEVHENASIGGDALILGHAGDGREIILGSVFIGPGAIIGARCVILPDVRIGRDSRVGAGAVVVRGTIIPDGETWAGVPARRISSRRDIAKPS